MQLINLTGKRFGRWIVVSYDKNLFWNCKCDCGTSKRVFGKSLRNGASKSCGCLSSELKRIRATTHGKNRTTEHKIWMGMKARCNIPSASGYMHYGGRGINVSKDWEMSFEKFLEDMGEIPGHDYSIERKDVNGSYCKENCIWVKKTDQAKNVRRNIKIKINDTWMILSDACKYLDINYSIAYRHYRKGDLVDFLKLRTSKAAQGEIREIALEIQRQLHGIAPEIF